MKCRAMVNFIDEYGVLQLKDIDEKTLEYITVEGFDDDADHGKYADCRNGGGVCVS